MSFAHTCTPAPESNVIAPTSPQLRCTSKTKILALMHSLTSLEVPPESMTILLLAAEDTRDLFMAVKLKSIAPRRMKAEPS